MPQTYNTASKNSTSSAMIQIGQLVLNYHVIINFDSKSRVFHTAAEGLSGEEGEEGKRKFFNNIKGQIDTVNEALNNVEKDLNQSINPPTTLLLRLSNISLDLLDRSSFAKTFLF